MLEGFAEMDEAFKLRVRSDMTVFRRVARI
jgi:hypothetical protein